MTVACLASQGASGDLPPGVKVVVLEPARLSPTRGSLNPFFHPARLRGGATLRRATWLFAFVRGIRSWGRLAVASCGDVDAWHAHDLTGLIAIAPSLPAGARLVYDSHELFLEQGTALRLPGFARRLLRWYEARLVSRSTAVITVNAEIAAELQRRYRPRRIDVIHNCPSGWFPPPAQSSLLRDSTGIPSDSLVVLYHGGITANRGIEALMQAIGSERLRDVHLVLMGFGERQEEYLRASRSGPGRDRIHFADPVRPSELLTWVASADIGAMPNPGLELNDRFSTPNKLFECLAAGTPVVASDFPTMRRIVLDDPDGPLGALCDPTQIDSIVNAILSIGRLDPAARSDLRARCLRATAARWNWDREADKLRGIYASIFAERNVSVRDARQ